MFNKKDLTPKQGYHSEGRRFASKIHYTVTPIENIEVWKKEQKAKQSLISESRIQARNNAIQAVSEQNLQIQPDKESTYIDQLGFITEVMTNIDDKGRFIYESKPYQPKPDASSFSKTKKFLHLIKEAFWYSF